MGRQDPQKERSSRGWWFVVHEHAASRHHYDLRLEAGGALASWAVPKGPSMVPGARRLAVQVEAHDLAYGHFEGTIPEGSYGAGDVIVWDEGTYDLVGATNPARAIAAGKMKIRLHGSKLRGGFTLVRIHGRAGPNAWLLIKERDREADPNWRIEAHPRSIASGHVLGSTHA